MKMTKLKVLAVSAAFSLLLGCGASFERNLNDMRKNTQFKKYDVEQVFRDHNGYRIYHKTDDGRLIEEKYFEFGFQSLHYDDPKSSDFYKEMHEYKSEFKSLSNTFSDGCVQVYKDLKPGEKAYALVLETKVHRSSFDYSLTPNGSIEDKMYYVEVHMPENNNISPGNETWGGKYKTTSPMGEIR